MALVQVGKTDQLGAVHICTAFYWQAERVMLPSPLSFGGVHQKWPTRNVHIQLMAQAQHEAAWVSYTFKVRE